MPHFGEERVHNETRKVYAHLHYSIYKVLGIETTDKWNTRPNQYVKRKMLVLWYQAVHTDREVTARYNN